MWINLESCLNSMGKPVHLNLKPLICNLLEPNYNKLETAYPLINKFKKRKKYKSAKMGACLGINENIYK